MDLSIVTITNGQHNIEPFIQKTKILADRLGVEFVIGADGKYAESVARKYANIVVPVKTRGLQEDVISLVVSECQADWILRIDDDDVVSDALARWLEKRIYLWKGFLGYSFPYTWLWGNENQFITTPPLWPDLHTRLLTKQFTLEWPKCVHAGPPIGCSVVVLGMLLHHKFLVKSYEKRLEIAEIYDSKSPGAGTGKYYISFTLPEDKHKTFTVMPVGDGTVIQPPEEWIGKGEVIAL